MGSVKKRILILFSWLPLLFAACLFCLFSCGMDSDTDFPSYKEFKKQELNRLIEIRDAKAEKAGKWLKHQKDSLEDSKTRKPLFGFFTQMKKLVSTGADKDRFLDLNREIEHFFVYNLSSFYDILFIDENEKVFYSVKMEDDFQSSLKTGPYSKTRLAEIIRKEPEKTEFVDFQYYGASDEAAAFCVIPVRKNGNYRGTIALQLSINHLNQLLTQRSGLGKTGEAYLVNNSHLMLTESRFINSSTVLSKKIDTAAVDDMAGQSGANVITDYRGTRVLSTFRSISAGRTNWRIIVEKDENEVITDYYRAHSGKLFPLLAESIKTRTEKQKKKAAGLPLPGQEAKRVDVSELLRAGGRKQLFTPGITTCTGVVACGPGGSAYMAHLSPTDTSYESYENQGQQAGIRSTDLVSLMLRRIQYFEIKPCQLHELRFMIAAPHAESLKGIIEKLTDAGISLAQIRAGISREPSGASLFYNVDECALESFWYTDREKPVYRVDFDSLPDLAGLVGELEY